MRVNRPDIFADLEESPFGREDFEKLMEEENSFSWWPRQTAGLRAYVMSS